MKNLVALSVLLAVLTPTVAFAKRIPTPKVTPLVSEGVNRSPSQRIEPLTKSAVMLLSMPVGQWFGVADSERLAA